MFVEMLCSIEIMVRDVLKVMDYFGWKRVYIVGYFMGIFFIFLLFYFMCNVIYFVF